MMPSRFFEMIASSEDPTIAARYACAAAGDKLLVPAALDAGSRFRLGSNARSVTRGTAGCERAARPPRVSEQAADADVVPPIAAETETAAEDHRADQSVENRADAAIA